MLANSTHWLHRACSLCEQPVLFGSWPTLALHLDRSPFHPRFAFPLRWMVQGCPSMGNPFGGVKVHRTFTLFRLTIATAMPLRAIGQSALLERPESPTPGEKSALGSGCRASPTPQPFDSSMAGYAHRVLNTRPAAATVASISCSPWAADTKPASNADGARYTPSSSMPW